MEAFKSNTVHHFTQTSETKTDVMGSQITEEYMTQGMINIIDEEIKSLEINLAVTSKFSYYTIAADIQKSIQSLKSIKSFVLEKQAASPYSKCSQIIKGFLGYLKNTKNTALLLDNIVNSALSKKNSFYCQCEIGDLDGASRLPKPTYDLDELETISNEADVDSFEVLHIDCTKLDPQNGTYFSSINNKPHLVSFSESIVSENDTESINLDQKLNLVVNNVSEKNIIKKLKSKINMLQNQITQERKEYHNILESCIGHKVNIILKKNACELNNTSTELPRASQLRKNMEHFKENLFQLKNTTKNSTFIEEDSKTIIGLVRETLKLKEAIEESYSDAINLLHDSHTLSIKSIVEFDTKYIKTCYEMIKELERIFHGDTFRNLLTIKYSLKSWSNKLHSISLVYGIHDDVDVDTVFKINGHLLEYFQYKVTVPETVVRPLYNGIKENFEKLVQNKRLFLLNELHVLKENILDALSYFNTKSVVLKKLEFEIIVEKSAENGLHEHISTKNELLKILEEYENKLIQSNAELSVIETNTELDDDSFKTKLKTFSTYFFEATKVRNKIDIIIENIVITQITKLTKANFDQSEIINDLKNNIDGITKIVIPFHGQIVHNAESSNFVKKFINSIFQTINGSTETKLKEVLDYTSNIENENRNLEKKVKEIESTNKMLREDKQDAKQNFENVLGQQKETLASTELKLNQQIATTKNLENTYLQKCKNYKELLKENEILKSEKQKLNTDLESIQEKCNQYLIDLESNKANSTKLGNSLFKYKHELQNCIQQKTKINNEATGFIKYIHNGNVTLSKRFCDIFIDIQNHCQERSINELTQYCQNILVQTSVNHIKVIEEQAKSHEEKIKNFRGTATDVQYLHAKEMLLRCHFNLDNINGRNNDVIISERRRVNSYVSNLLKILEAKVSHQ